MRTGNWRLVLPGALVAGSIVALALLVGAFAGWGRGVPVALTASGGSWRVTASYPLAEADLDAVACTTAQDCEAVGRADAIGPGTDVDLGSEVYVTTDGGLRWSPRGSPVVDDLVALSCPTRLHCVALGLTATIGGEGSAGTSVEIGAGGIVASTKRMLGPVLAVSQSPPESISCTSSQVCEASVGPTAYRTDDGGNTWRAQHIPREPGDEFSRISCPSPSDCTLLEATPPGLVPATGIGSAIWTTADGGTSWIRRPVAPGLALDGLSCPTVDTCLAVGLDEPVSSGGFPIGATASNPATPISISPPGTAPTAQESGPLALDSDDGGSSWQRVALPAELANPVSVSCPSAMICEVDSSEAVTRSTDGGLEWGSTSQPTGFPTLGELSCGGILDCVIATQSGPLVTGDGGRAWSSEELIPGLTLTAVSCVGSGVCLASGSTVTATTRGTDVFVRSAPFAAGWGAPQPFSDPRPFDALVCSSSLRCVTYPQYQSSIGVLTLAPSGTNARWHVAQIGLYPSDVSCGSVLECTAIDSVRGGATSSLFVSTDGGASWAPRAGAAVAALEPIAVSCPSGPVCDLLGQTASASSGSYVLLRTTNDWSSWSVRRLSGSSWLSALACPSPSVCEVSADYSARGTASAGTALRTSDGGATWSRQLDPRQGVDLMRVACTSATVCEAEGGADEVFVTTDGGSRWTLQRLPRGVVLSAICPLAPRAFAAVGVDEQTLRSVILVGG
ncbi:MAG TPA: hypothetical protein VMD59_22280 [Acidimicrobiales bacterium]|nr:hypothetical protein [Acidimicrobiales bacterium]